MMFRRLFPEQPLLWTRENPEKTGILLMRFLFSLMWLSQGLAKLVFRNPNDPFADHNHFLNEVHYMKNTNPIPLVVVYIEKIILPRYEFFLYLVILVELGIGISLGLGLFTRLGSIIGGLMTIQLWILTLGWGEWLWTYPLIFMPHVLFFLSRSGRYVGVDRLLLGKNELFDKLA